ncbi:MAG: valine--tRNA ligase, partial [Pseudomonadota bacterium]
SQKYNPSEFEKHIYAEWEKNNYFHGEDKSKKPQFSIVLPPPNVTGALHLGHALVLAIQDAVVRRKRMQGFNTVWFPGTDHAGIATQMVVEKELMKEGKTRHDLGREKFIERVWEVKKRHYEIITNQTKTMGASLDWERERFTLDDKFHKAVYKVFVELYKKGLIYRGEKLISWCTRCGTALSDLEVEQKPENGKLYYIKYFVKGEPENYVTVATTRPETLMGDTAVAVNSKDKRFKKFHGKKVVIPFVNRDVPIILDEYVDMEFGTGCLKITPGHDFNDYEIGRKHKLDAVTVIDKDGKLNKNAAMFNGLTPHDAREKVIAELDKNGALEKIEDYATTSSKCGRCETVIEPLLGKQWFIKMEGMAKRAIDAVKDEKIKFYPRGWWEETYYRWLENIRDWCISRQLWWGHRIPVWYCKDCNQVLVAETAPTDKCKCGCYEWIQDSDVLDTWFSAAMWPFVSPGWPEKTDALKTFYPNSFMETGFDIIFFWVARMIMLGLEFMDDVPFKDVLYHAMIRDEKGQKMSKTKGNVIDPLVMTEKYGVDAFRFTLASMAGRARDVRLSENTIEGHSHFMNKIWQATKFTFSNAQGFDKNCDVKKLKDPLNKWIVSRFNSTAKAVNERFEIYALNDAAELLYKFFWHEFCDWYIEFSKPMLADDKLKGETKYVLLYVHREFLKLMHPFTPFITEKLFMEHPLKDGDTIMLQKYPEAEQKLIHEGIESDFELVQEFVANIRNIKAIYGIMGKNDVIAVSKKYGHLIKSISGQIIKTAGINKLDVHDSVKGLELKKCIRAVLPELEIYVPAEGLIDFEKETARLNKKLEAVTKDLNITKTKLANAGFLGKAGEDVIEKEKGKLTEFGKLQTELKNAIKTIESLR